MADIYGTNGNDTLDGTSGEDNIFGFDGNDTIDGGAGNDVVIGDWGDDVLLGGAGADFINGGDGNDVIYADEQDTHVRGDAGYDVVYIQGSVGVNWILENFYYTGIEELHGTSGNDSVNNYGVADMAIYGEGGDDTLMGNLGNQTLDGGAGNDLLSGGNGDDVLRGGNGDDQLTGDWGHDVLTGGAGVDLMNGGDGDDLLNADASDLYVRGDAGYDKVYIEGSTGVNWYIDGFYKSGFEEVHGSSGADTIVNWEQTAVSLFGRGADDFLAGNSGNDTLAGGTENDTLYGGDGDDRYLFNLGDGIDTIQDTSSGTGNRVVFGAGIGQQDLTLIHDQLSQILTIQVGATGDAIRLVNFDPNGVSGSMVVSTLFFDDGSQVSLADLLGLGSGSGATITGTNGDDFLQGTAGGDVIDGLAGNDMLDGLGGDDTMTGGAGADQLFGGNGNDVLNVDAADFLVMGGDGYDVAYVNDSQGMSWSMNDFGNFGGLEEVYGGAGSDTLSYYGQNDVVLDGGAGQDGLSGGSGNDMLAGGDGNDYLNGQDGNDLLLGGAGDDNLFGDDFFSLTGGHDILEGGAGQDFLHGSVGNDRLDGGAGADYMEGGAGDDTYVIDDYSDVVLEGYGAGGIDAIESQLYFYNLLGTEFENLTLVGPNAVYGYGSQFANIIVGNEVANTLAGGDGNDQLSGEGNNDWLSGGQGRDVIHGGAGDDVLVGDDGSIFTSGENDTIYGDDGNDILHGEGGNDSLYGGAGYDYLTGGTGNDFLDGGNGFEGDQMVGGLGNDTYVMDPWYDQVSEAPNEGVDTIETAINYIWMGSYPNIENLTFTGMVGNQGYGNELDNVIIGNIGSDMLDGRMGNDILRGGDGQDQLVGGEGDDFLMGEAGVDFLFGADGSDRLDGGAGMDIMYGNTGDDTYIADDQNDYVWEYVAEGADTVESSISYVLGSDLENLTLTGSMAFTGTGNELDNVLTGNSLDNTLDGGAGTDTLAGGIGNDQLIGGAGNDTYRFNLGDGIDTIQDFSFPVEGNRILFGQGITRQDLTLTHNPIEQTLTIQVGPGGDAIRLTNFDPSYSRVIATLQFNDGSQVAMAELLGPTQGDDILNGTPGDDVIDGLGGNDVINGLAGNDTLLGGEGHDTLNGGDGDDVLDGGIYSDTMAGGAGNDTYIVDQFDETVTEAVGEGVDTVQSSISGYTLSAHVENLTLTGTAMTGSGNELDNVLVGNDGFNLLNGWAGNDQLNGGLSADIMAGMAGDDTYVVDDAGDVLIESAGEGNDTAYSSVSYDLSTQGNEVETLILTGTSSIDAKGNGSDNTLSGNTGDNILDGSFGNDTLQGAGGNDTYIVSEFGDVVIEQANDGVDTVRSSVAFYALGTNVENLLLTGFAFDGTGNELSNILTGNDMNNRLDGGANSDIMIGGLGDDTYVVDNDGVASMDLVVENAGEGIDTVESSVDYTLTANVERLTLTGSAVRGTGNESDNTIQGTDENNIIDGGIGADTMAGALGDDIYVVDNVGDVIIDVGPGMDTVQTAMSYELGMTAALEHLTLTGSAAVNGTGNFIDNTITGNEAANVLDGQAGDDTLIGGGGNDRLAGGFGLDTLVGGTGNDSYVVDQDTDTIVELANEGIDTVESTSFDYTLSAHVEHLTLTGTGFQRGVGNISDNTMMGTADSNVLLGEDGNDVLQGNDGSDSLNGGAGSDLLDGGVGADMMYGGTGDDVYQVDDAADLVFEIAGEGNDTINSLVSYTLLTDSEVETVILTGSASNNATGSFMNNILIGNSGDNLLDGSAGGDTMQGGAGNDTYVVDNVVDVITENLNEGMDTVQSSVTYTLGADTEHLTLTGVAAINATGNSLNNVLTGNSAVNVLAGNAGDDIYAVGAGDSVLENANDGTDTVQSSVSFTLGANVENLTLTGSATVNATGNSLANMLVGNSAANVIDGATGADSMSGGQGDDTYLVENAGDTVTELANEGTDTVQSSRTYTLGANVENLTLTGATAINGTGNGLDNILTGNSAANVLTGAAGNDTYIIGAGDSIVEVAGGGTDTVQSALTHTLGANLENLTLTGSSAINGTGNSLANVLTGNSAANVLSGGAGNDTYVVGAGDSVVDSGGGADTVQSSVAWTLGSNIENLTLTGSAAINGTGNGSNNILIGNSVANTLSGANGTDTLRGGLGNDTANGGSGNDLFQFGRGEGQDLVQDNSGSGDKILYDAGINPLDLVISRQANDLRLAIHGSTDYVTVQNWYTSSSNRTETIQAGDGQILLSTQVDQLIQAMAGFTQQTGLSWDQGIDQQPAEVQSILAASWQ